MPAEISSVDDITADTEMPPEVVWTANDYVGVITLNRPKDKNALNDAVSLGIAICIKKILASKTLRVVFFTGNGAMFCAGGDPKAFQAAAAAAAKAKETGAAEADNDNDKSAMAFAKMLEALNSLPVYLVGLVNGSAMGGGVGLVSVCDYVVARKSAFFALSEVKLGVIPATISPYVIAKIGAGAARKTFMTGDTMKVDEAVKVGLVNEIVETPDEMKKVAERILTVMKLSAPGAAAAAKSLILNVVNKPITEELMAYTANQLAMVRVTEECASGMIAVQAGKKPPWSETPLVYP